MTIAASHPSVTRFADLTRISKTRYGWEAMTRVPFGERHALKFMTGKGPNGLTTVVRRVEVDKGFDVYAPGRDYRLTVNSRPNARCTERAITDLHLQSLAEFDRVAADVRAFYGTE